MVGTNLWQSSIGTDEWLETQNTKHWKKQIDEDGFLAIKQILTMDEVKIYRTIYDRFLTGEINAETHRHDLGSHSDKKVENEENICQIMWPSVFMPELLEGPFHKRALRCARLLLGEDLELDFDMIISKAAFTDTATPFHQDVSYWPDLPDKRAVSVWLSLDKATIDNGCMQFVPGSHKLPTRQHRPAEKGHHALCCEAREEEFVAVPLDPGGCTLHHGKTIHFTKGNKTSSARRALIVNARPGPMVRLEREKGFDHGKSLGAKTILREGQGHRK